MEILNKLCAVFACLFPLHYDVLVCGASKKRWRQEMQKKILSLIYSIDVKHLRLRYTIFLSRFPYRKNTGLYMCSFTSWWQWKTVKIDTVIKGTSGNGEKKKNSSAVERKWVCCCSRLSKSKTTEQLGARLLWEPGAQNHLRSPTLLPRGPPCPLQALSMFKSFISGERLRGVVI